MIVTRHGDKRTRKRVGVNRSAVERTARKALTYGVSRLSTQGSLRRYLDYLYHYNESAGKIRVWAEKVYIFTDGDILITVLDLPQRYKKRANSMSKKGECNAAERDTEPAVEG